MIVGLLRGLVIAGGVMVSPVRDFALHGLLVGFVLALIATAVPAIAGRRR